MIKPYQGSSGWKKQVHATFDYQIIQYEDFKKIYTILKLINIYLIND